MGTLEMTSGVHGIWGGARRVLFYERAGEGSSSLYTHSTWMLFENMVIQAPWT
jgi:hypothetical protein